MKTLTELNGKVWYRFLKVLYIVFYITCFIIFFSVIHKLCTEYHDPILPDTVQEVLKDPDFYKLDNSDMKNVLSSMGSKSNDPWDNYIDKDDLVQRLKKQPIPTTPLKKKYKYTSYYTFNITNCILYGLITTFCYILFMECIRRGFYYVLIGKVFPKE